jgi:ribonuclease-3
MFDLNADGLQKRLEYRFKDVGILKQALTHKSYANENRSAGVAHNERLEFLGDTVLEFVISDHIMKVCPDSSEGRLSKMRAVSVSESNLSRIARRLGIGEYLLLGRGEEQTGGREKNSLLANCTEAVFAAVYLDGGIEQARDLILRLFSDDVEKLAVDSVSHDSKTDLQELCQSSFGELPVYNIISESGPDHQKEFEVEITASGRLLARGTGKSKKDAEQKAATLALEGLKGE